MRGQQIALIFVHLFIEIVGILVVIVYDKPCMYIKVFLHVFSLSEMIHDIYLCDSRLREHLLSLL